MTTTTRKPPTIAARLETLRQFDDTAERRQYIWWQLRHRPDPKGNRRGQLNKAENAVQKLYEQLKAEGYQDEADRVLAEAMESRRGEQ